MTRTHTRLLAVVAAAAILLASTTVLAREATLAEEFKPPRVVGITARESCLVGDVVQCTYQGRKSHIEMEFTVLNGPGGGSSIDELPIALVGTTSDTGPYRMDVNNPRRCSRDDYCMVPRQRQLTITAKVSREFSVFKTSIIMNHLPFAQIATDTDLTAENITFADISTNPAYGVGVPSIVNTRKSVFAYGSGVVGCQSAMPLPDTVLGINDVAAAGGLLDASWADGIPNRTPLRSRRHTQGCVGAFCPADGAAWTTDRLLQIHEVGEQCALVGVNPSSEPHFEIEVVVRDEELGTSHRVYAIVGRGRSQNIYDTQEQPGIEVRARVMPMTRRANTAAPSMIDAAGIVLCDYAIFDNVTAELNRPPAQLAPNVVHNVATRRHGGVLFYAVTAEDIALYGRQPGQVGALAHTLFKQDAATLAGYCYGPSNITDALVPDKMPAAVSERLNRYAANNSAAAVRPVELLGKEFMGDHVRNTFLANVDDNGKYRSSITLTRAIVHEATHLPREVLQSEHNAHSVRMRVDIGDSVLTAPHSDRYHRSVYAQRLAVDNSRCEITNRTGALSIRYNRPANAPTVTMGGGRKPYTVNITCDASVGYFMTGRANQTIAADRQSSVVRFSATVGGPKGPSGELGIAIPIRPNVSSVQAAEALYANELEYLAYVGGCTLQLFDGTFPDIEVDGPETIDCYYTNRRDADPVGTLTIGPVDCGLFSTEEECVGYAWVLIGIVVGLVALAISMLMGYACIAACIAIRASRSITPPTTTKVKTS